MLRAPSLESRTGIHKQVKWEEKKLGWLLSCRPSAKLQCLRSKPTAHQKAIFFLKESSVLLDL